MTQTSENSDSQASSDAWQDETVVRFDAVRKEARLVRITHHPYSEPAAQTDWERLHAMTDEEVEEAARNDPNNPPLSEEELRRFRRVPNVFAIRRQLNMSQLEFAEAFEVPLQMVIELEEKRYFPNPILMTLLRIIEHEPEAVQRAIKQSYRRRNV